MVFAQAESANAHKRIAAKDARRESFIVMSPPVRKLAHWALPNIHPLLPMAKTRRCRGGPFVFAFGQPALALQAVQNLWRTGQTGRNAQ
jgi:hypothetical protein